MSERKDRLANIELLRIVAMLLIVCYHFSSHALILVDYDFNDPNRFFNWLMRGIGYIGVDVYILISAFFLCKGHFKSKKLIQLIIEVWFYSFVIYLLFVGTNKISFSVKGLVTSFFPTLFSQYWFVTCYVALYVLSPFLNHSIKALYEAGRPNTEEYMGGKTVFQNPLFKFTVLLVVLFSVIPQFVPFSEWLHSGGTCGIVWMIVVYFIGASLRYFIDLDSLRKRKKTICAIAVTLWVFPLITKIVIANVSQTIVGSVEGSSLFYMNNSVVIVASSIFTFLAFCTLNVKRWGQIIKYIAPSTLAVYLIHDNNYVRPVLWSYVNGIISQEWMILYTIVLTLSIFFICILVDFVRRGIFYIVSPIIEKLSYFAKSLTKLDKWFAE